MMKKTGILIVLIFLWGFLFGDGTGDWRYKKICTQGWKGYQMYRKEYGPHSRKDFWNYFYNLILNFKVKKEFGNILACSEFWDELKHDEIFDFEEVAREDKKEINNIFASAQNEYRKYLKERMFALAPIDLKGETDAEKIKEYTDDKEFTQIIKIYVYNYIILSKNPLPKQEEINNIAGRWQEMSGDNRVKDAIKKPIDDYFYQLGTYYRIQIKETDSYDRKLDISRSKKIRLEEIKLIAASIDQFNIKKQLPQIDKMIRGVDPEVEYWQRHKTINDMITAFEKKPNPTLDDLYDTRKKVIAAAQEGIRWERPLFERIRVFFNLPGKRYLTIQWFEKNVEQNLNDNNKIVEILKSEYKNRLFAEVVMKMIAGGDSVEDLIEIEILTGKYKRLFKEETGKENCLALIRTYYQAKERYDYTKMITLYDEAFGITVFCEKVMRAWQMKSKEEVKQEYKKYYVKLMHEALSDEGRKTVDTFDAFWLVHAKKDWSPPQDYRKRFTYLYTYFKSPTGSVREKAAKDLHKYYPDLAYCYRIPDPEAEVSYTEGGGESTTEEEVTNAEEQTGPSDTAENDYKKLVKMWQAVKGMKTERQVVDYVLHQAPLRIKGSNSAQKTLTWISKWHNQWRVFGKLNFKEFRVFAMLGEMLTWSDNIRDQNELYNHMIIRMSEANITFFRMPEPEQNKTMTLVLIKKYIDNNNEYLNLLNGNKSGKNLDSIEQSLRLELLSIPQKIRAYYQCGTLSFTLRRKLHSPPCYHFAKAWELMHEKGYTKLNLDWNGTVIISKSDLARRICFHCNPVKRSQSVRNEFNRQYPNSNLNIDTICEKAGRLSPVEIDKPTDGDSGTKIKSEDKTTGARKMNILDFLEIMHTFVKKSRLDDPVLSTVCKELIYSDLNGPGFDRVMENYKQHIPQNYDAIMNRFLYLVYAREEGWQKKAKKIIKTADWIAAIKTKMKKILEEIKTIFD